MVDEYGVGFKHGCIFGCAIATIYLVVLFLLAKAAF